MTPPEINPGTVRLVAQRLNHYATPGPIPTIIGLTNFLKKKVALLHAEMQWTPTSLVSPTSPFVSQYPLYGAIPSSAIPSPCLLSTYRCYFLSIPRYFPTCRTHGHSISTKQNNSSEISSKAHLGSSSFP